MLRGWNKDNLIVFTDIAAADFDPHGLGKDLDVLMRSIHGRFDSGGWVSGPDVFRELYLRVGFPRAVQFSRLPGIRHLVALSYRIFAHFRYKAAVRRINKSRCSSDVGCDPFDSRSIDSRSIDSRSIGSESVGSKPGQEMPGKVVSKR